MKTNQPVIILGAGVIGKVAYDAFISNGVVVYGFLDNDLDEGTEIEDSTVLGRIEENSYLDIIGKDCTVFVAEDDNTNKQELIDLIKDKRKVMPANAVHSDSNISPSSFLGYGNLISKGASIGAFSRIENHCMIGANSVIDATAICNDYVQIGPGAIVNSGVVIEEEAFIGSGAILISGIKIGKGARVGAGSVVISDIPAGKTFFGNPAKEM